MDTTDQIWASVNQQRERLVRETGIWHVISIDHKAGCAWTSADKVCTCEPHVEIAPMRAEIGTVMAQAAIRKWDAKRHMEAIKEGQVES